MKRLSGYNSDGYGGGSVHTGRSNQLAPIQQQSKVTNKKKDLKFVHQATAFANLNSNLPPTSEQKPKKKKKKEKENEF